jgi:hypothetical protein
MRKSVYLAAIFVALVFVFAGCGKKPATQNGAEGTNVKADETSVEEFSATLEEMAKKGKPYKCNYTMKEGEMDQEGTVYFGGGADMMRGDISMTVPQTGITLMHFIKDGETQYIWTEGQATGMKVTWTAEDEAKAKETAEDNTQSVDTNTKVSLKCSKWSPDGAMFQVPGDVKFQDLSEMMQGLPGAVSGSAGAGESGGAGYNGGSIDLCAVCDQVPAGAARDSCKQSNCN